jgi:starch synthase
VPADDPAELARAVNRVLSDPAGYGERGRERAHREFSVAKMAERTLAVYESALR